jgi:hypothetical protein
MRRLMRAASEAGSWVVHFPEGATCSPNKRIMSAAVADIVTDPGHPARPWRRTARSDLYDRHRVGRDPRSDGRTGF